jgi:hypothetical protein
MARTDWQMGDTVQPADLNQIGQEINEALSKANDPPVKSVNTKTGDVVLTAADVGAETPAGAQAKADAVQANLNAHLAESAIQAASGSANAITITTGGNFQYTQGKRIAFKASANNTGNVTLNVDGKGAKPLLKLDGSQIPSGGIKSGKVYEAYYDTASGGRFFLLARAEGNAVADKVLAGYTFSNDDDTGIPGAMLDRSSGSYASGIQTRNGTTLELSIPANAYYGTGAKITRDDPNWIASNIRNGISIFGLVGSLVEGKKYVEQQAYYTQWAGTEWRAYITGLTFLPSLILVVDYDGTTNSMIMVGVYSSKYSGLNITFPLGSSNDYFDRISSITSSGFTVYNYNRKSTDYIKCRIFE